ncbi:MAG: glycine cleavage system aminomethyltransferase GcvT [Peptostreptococcaceae bacterium]|nr:glycine cleavage system aminomethyltransferase GcvT [Peptostreptococcaceae bacterium]
MDKKTPLYETHIKYGGKMVPFGGYILPVQYETGVKKEHIAVRTTCGLFDVSHMGEIIIRGKDSLEFLNYVLSNDYTNMKDGQVRYGIICNENGGAVDDLLVYKKANDDYLLVPNASNKDKDFDWIVSHKRGEVEIKDVSAQYGQLALQGPNAEKILTKLIAKDQLPNKYYTAEFGCKLEDVVCMISRTGYTGEDGFEIYMSAPLAPKVWEMIIEAGKDEGLIPCGLGARDTLRLEAGMPLYGHEMNEERPVRTVGLGFAIKMNKEDFIGKEAMLKQGDLKEKIVGLKITGRGIAREHCDVYKGDEKIGITTSGTYLPYMEGAYALALVEVGLSDIGTELEVDVRGRRISAEVVNSPFYKR